ncbi:MAG: glycosyltransferase [Prevotellaceae bacterium]|nr:glycosyltransferase [Prevotellaceae bacterium]
MKPRILILMHYMELGGAESALLGLLQSIDPDRADVDLFIYDHRGELMRYIPTDKVHLLPEVQGYKMIERPMKECIVACQFGVAWGRLLAKKTVDTSPVPQGREDIRIYTRVADCVERFLPKIQPGVEYDLAISFLMPHNYVIRKVRAKKKIGWIHTDYSTVYVDVKRELPVWSQLDYIVSISENVGERFIEMFPTLRNKLISIENILCSDFVWRKAKEISVPLCSDKSVTCLLTIGRFSNPKKMEDIPAICRGLIELGLDVKWFIIGYGSDTIERTIKENIKKERVENNVILLGKKDNPYPYIKACDMYVQPSRYEGKSITVREAQILCKPVVVTNYPTASSQVQDGVDGVIVPMEIGACIKVMADFIQNKEKQNSIVAYLSSHDYGNQSEIEKIYRIAEGC